MIFPPLALHISDGVLVWPSLPLGFALSALLLVWASWRIPDEQIPRIGLLTAAFFVGSLIHVRVGPTSVHLILNGLVGIILGRRAALAIAVGLLLQCILLQHGGYSVLGVNCCIMSLPALFARPVFQQLTKVREYPSFRYRDGLLAVAYLLYPMAMWLLAGMMLIGRRLRWGGPDDADFRAGFAVGVGCVLLTALLNGAMLVIAGSEDWRLIAAVVVAAHIPIALIEGIIVGCTVSFLRRVKPELLDK